MDRLINLCLAVLFIGLLLLCSIKRAEMRLSQEQFSMPQYRLRANGKVRYGWSSPTFPGNMITSGTIIWIEGSYDKETETMTVKKYLTKTTEYAILFSSGERGK
jgi:hypothetical protein